MVKYDTPMVASSGYVATVDEESCKNCGVCAKVCPFNAVEVNGTTTVIWDKCMGCGVCVGQCRAEAISLQRDEKKGVPLDVEVLIKEGAG
jgi:Pyruvate/2-oxoacid:ferredoxin oxidoreductase delta subunit